MKSTMMNTKDSDERDGGEEDTVVEDQLDRLKKQYDDICQTWEAYRIACNRLTKEEENVKEDWVVEDSWNWAVMKSYKKQYDDMLTEYTKECEKYRDHMKVTMMKEQLKKKYNVIRQTREVYRKSCDSLTYEEENAEEDWVAEDTWSWQAMKFYKKQ